MTQVAAEALGLPIERVKFILGDTRLPKAPIHGGSLTMASVGSAVQAACQKAREDALARGGANDLMEAMRRLGEPVEASVDNKPGDAARRFSMHAFGAVFVEVTVDPDLVERACGGSSAPTGQAASSTRRRPAASASAA